MGVRLARHAMATRFELVLPGNNDVALRAAGEEALDEIERLENRLSLYRPGSEIAQVNAEAAYRPVRVTPPIFDLLRQARHYFELSDGAFDITIAPLVRCWGFMKGTGRLPLPEEIRVAKESVGMNLVELDANNYTVRFLRPGIMIDLGSIGKGYAIDQAMEILSDTGIENALLHGGTSTVAALGENPEEGAWKISVQWPKQEGETETQPPLAVVELKNEALSVSAVWGKSFSHEGRTYGHLIDPRTGWPAEHGLLAGIVGATATETDALSTAVLLAGADELKLVEERSPGLRYLRVSQGSETKPKVTSRGISLLQL